MPRSLPLSRSFRGSSRLTHPTDACRPGDGTEAQDTSKRDWVDAGAVHQDVTESGTNIYRAQLFPASRTMNLLPDGEGVRRVTERLRERARERERAQSRKGLSWRCPSLGSMGGAGEPSC